jgi:hypothetical protein
LTSLTAIAARFSCASAKCPTAVQSPAEGQEIELSVAAWPKLMTGGNTTGLAACQVAAGAGWATATPPAMASAAASRPPVTARMQPK